MNLLSNILNLIKNNKRNILADAKISMAILSSFVILMIQYFILSFFGINETSMGANIQITSKIIVGIAFIDAFFVVFRRNGILLIMTYSVAIALFAFNFMFFEPNRPYLLGIAFKLFFISLPCFIYSHSIKDLNIFESITKKAGKVIYSFGVILGILVLTKKISIGYYSMTMSYYMLLPTIVFFKEFFDKGSMNYLLLSTFSTIIMLAIGSRGAIMCLGVYIILYQVINLKKVNLGKILFYMMLLFVIVVCIIFLKEILMILNNILIRFGIYSRSLYLFLIDEVHLSGREILYEEIIKQIFLHPIIGIGIAGDRVYTGGYVHNIFLEIVSGFGVIIGTIIIIILCYIIFKTLLSKDKYKANLALIWLCIGFVPLIVSGSYLIEFQFWIFIGIALNRNRYKV